ncbi:SH3 domain-containing protein [Treponema sp. OMZ 840]|uniref:SH3 domain-containing protein n=1 Tax=Treponema sp. OMZ 840 TaxID=244313 RepID=UPI003D8CBAAC
MKSIPFYVYMLLCVCIYAENPVIGQNDIHFLAPEVAVQKAERYAYKTYDVHVSDIPDKVRNNFFATAVFVEQTEKNGLQLRNAYNAQGYVSREELFLCLNDVTQGEYVLFDDRKDVHDKIQFLLHRKLRYNDKIIGECAVGFLYQKNAPYPSDYWIECAFLNGEDRISFIKLYGNDSDIVSFVSKTGKERFAALLETRSENVPTRIRAFSDLYDKLYISVQNLFDMKLPLRTTAFYTQANLNIRDKAGTDGTKLRTVNKGTKLKIVEIGAKEKIDGITAPWVRVRLEDGTEGWCFSGYLTAKRIYKAVLDMETPVMDVRENRITPLNTVDRITINNVTIRIGDKKPENLISDILLETPFLELYKFGDLPGCEKDGTVFAWNNMNSIIFITTVNPAAVTPLGITIGSTKEDVLRAYGKPFLTTKNRIEYNNSDYELVGMIFYFENDKVVRITCFTHI